MITRSSSPSIRHRCRVFLALDAAKVNLGRWFSRRQIIRLRLAGHFCFNREASLSRLPILLFACLTCLDFWRRISCAGVRPFRWTSGWSRRGNLLCSVYLLFSESFCSRIAPFVWPFGQTTFLHESATSITGSWLRCFQRTYQISSSGLQTTFRTQLSSASS